MKNEELKIDIGASYVKAEFKQEVKKFPTSIRKIDVINGFTIKTKSYNYKNKNYIVGKVGAKTIISRDFAFFKEYSPLIVYKILQEFDIEDVSNINLNIGFSFYYIDHFKDIVEELKNFTVNSMEFKFGVINCFIQGQGIYNYLKTKLGLKGNIAIFDIGYHTNDFLLFDNEGELLETDSTKDGIVSIVSKLQRKLNFTFEMELTESQINEVLQNKCIEIDGDKQDLEEVINELVIEYTTKVKFDLKAKFGPILKDCSKVIIAGGGANYFVEQSFPTNTLVEPDEFLNVKGYSTNY